MKPRVHGNGFIQLALTDTIRLHVWPDHTYPIKRQKVNTAIHTHRFSFKSKVISGELIHRVYRFQKLADMPIATPPTHKLYIPGDDERLYPTHQVGTFSIVDEVILKPGDEYTFNSGKFHATFPVADLSATLMEKRSISYDEVYVGCSMDEEPDNEFDRDDDNSEALLWGIIIQALARAK